MNINFDKYIDNPSGGTSVVTNRQMYKQMYKTKFDKILLREGGNIKFTLYKSDSADDSHYIHFKIPSEVVPNFYYDVVVQLYTNDNKQKTNANFRQHYVKFYSNDPAFVYTFAHSFIKNELFIEDLKPKMSKEAIRHVAKVKNPKDDVWYVKSIYFAYLAMEKYGLFARVRFNQNAEIYNKKQLLNNITQAEIKINERTHAEEKLKREKIEQENKIKREKGISVNNKATIKSKISKTAITSKVSKISKNIKRSKVT